MRAKHSLKSLLILVSLIFLLPGAGVVRSQVGSSQIIAQDRSNSQWKLQTATAEEIARENPSMSFDLLKEDGRAIQTAYPKVKTAFEKEGFTTSQVDQIVARAWKDYRSDHASGKLDSDRFVKYAEENFGGLSISSAPTGAAVYVDGKKWDDPTDCKGLTHTGRRKVVLIKEGYVEVDEYVQVNAGAWTSFSKTLKKK